MTEFKVDFTSRRKEVFRKYLDSLQDFTFLEIGAFEGRTTKFILENYKTSYAYVIDNFYRNKSKKVTEVKYLKNGETHSQQINIEKVKERFHSNLEECWDRITFYNEESQIALPKIDKEFDFIYVDGNHQGKYVLKDAITAIEKAKKNGIIFFDDYGSWEEINEVVDTVCRLYSDNVEILAEEEGILIVRKATEHIYK